MIIFESTFPQTFRREEIKKILDFVTVGKFCQLVSVPGGGKATTLRLLAHNRSLLRFHLGEKEKGCRFIYLNLYELPQYDEAQIAKFLLLALDETVKTQNDPLVLTKMLSGTVNKLANQGQTIIFLFDHFDEVQNRLPRQFFQMIKGLKNLARFKFAAIFATRRDLRELVDPQILADFYDFFIDNTLYLQIFDKDAIELLFSQIEKVFGQKIKEDDQKQITALSGGHTKLTKVLTESLLRNKITLDHKDLNLNPIVRATLLELWLFLTAQEQQALFKISRKMPVSKDDALENIIKFDLIKQPDQPKQFDNLQFQPASPAKRGEQFPFTIPLFEEFVKTVQPARRHFSYDPHTKEIKKGENTITDILSPQEYRLLKFLIENAGRVLERDEIIGAVWPDAQVLSGISDEAIDQLVFRLRKKIEDEPAHPKHLITVKGRGLRFTP